MRSQFKLFLLTLGFLVAAIPVAEAKKSDDEERAEIRQQTASTLQRLYKEQPGSQQAIENAVGYAVFSNFGMKILFAGGGKGEGLARDNLTGEETFMKMVEVQAGLGMGAKKFQLVWVFETQSTLDSFINSGWEVGAQASAAARSGDTGTSLEGAISISPGVWLYQMTEQGLALELTAKGTKYYKNDDLD
jgi:lipid-binding SYLF domain-containing protein